MAPPPTATPPDDRNLVSLQLVRALAAGVVVYLHTFTTPLFGLFGVDLFFVLSGFVMAHILATQPHKTPLQFLGDRLVRIVPLYWLVTTAVLLVALAAPRLMGTTVASAGHWLQSLLFIPHFRPDGSLFPVLMPGWSLNYEMVFYVAVGLALMGPREALTGWVVVLLAGFWAVGSAVDPAGATHAFTQSTLWLEFGLGLLAHGLWRRRALDAVEPPVAFALILLLLGSMVLLEGSADRLIIAGIPALGVLLLALRLEDPLRRLAGHAPLKLAVRVGDASYATYLTHMFVIGAIERLGFARLGIEKTTLTALATVACCLVVGEAVHRFVDQPLHRKARAGWTRLLLRHAPRATPAAMPPQLH